MVDGVRDARNLLAETGAVEFAGCFQAFAVSSLRDFVEAVTKPTSWIRSMASIDDHHRCRDRYGRRSTTIVTRISACRLRLPSLRVLTTSRRHRRRPQLFFHQGRSIEHHR